MPTLISVECPECGAILKLKDGSNLGKRAACPKCRKPFVLTAADVGDELDELDRFEEYDDDADEEFEPATPPPPIRPGGRTFEKMKRSASKSSGRRKTKLIIGGSIALSLLVGVGLWTAGLFSGDEPPQDQPVAQNRKPAKVTNKIKFNNKINLAWLPADAELIVRLKVADAWQSPLLQQFAGIPEVQQGLKEMQQAIGLELTDVESLTIGLSGISEQAQRGMNANPDAMAMESRDKFLAVARTKKAVSAKSLKLIKNGGQQVDHEGKKYFRFQPPRNSPDGTRPDPFALFLAGPKLIVIGTETKVKTAMATAGKQARRKELDFVDPDQHLLIVLVPRDKSKLTGVFAGAGGGPDNPTGELTQVLAKNLQAISIGVSVNSGVDLQVRANCTNDKAAAEIKTLLDGFIAQARDSFEEPTAEIPPALVSTIEQVLGSLKTSTSSETVTASVHVSDSSITSLKQSAGQLLAMAMLTGMNDGGRTEPDSNPLPLDTAAHPRSERDVDTND